MQNSQTFRNIFKDFFEFLRKPSQIEFLDKLLLELQIDISFGFQVGGDSLDCDWSPRTFTSRFADDTKFCTSWIDPITNEKEWSDTFTISIGDLINLRTSHQLPILPSNATHVLINPVRDSVLTEKVVDAMFPGALGYLVPGHRISDFRMRFYEKQAEVFTSYFDIPSSESGTAKLEFIANGYGIVPAAQFK